jgi:phosphatidylinositol glycan class U
MEVFEQFRLFFISVFHLNAVAFTIPICIRFNDRPLFCAFLLITFMALFKSYPSIADTAFCFPWMMVHSELFKYSPHMYVSVSGLLYSCLLGPLFFNAWVIQGSGNANFFYAITLVWSVSQIILLIDMIFGYLRRDWERMYPGWRKMRIELIYQYQ